MNIQTETFGRIKSVKIEGTALANVKEFTLEKLPNGNTKVCVAMEFDNVIYGGLFLSEM